MQSSCESKFYIVFKSFWTHVRSISPRPPNCSTGEHLQPLFHHARHLKVCLAILEHFNAKVMNDSTPGDGTMIRACLIRKVSCVGWFKNPEHLALVQADILNWLEERMADAADVRFYVPPIVEEAQGNDVICH